MKSNVVGLEISLYTRSYEIGRYKAVQCSYNFYMDVIKVLDKGEIRVIERMGDDQTIVNAARVSYGKGTKTKRDDQALIDYLLRNHHTSPFEMCEIMLYIKLPIFVAAQWIRHRTANVNGYSARYSIMEDVFYIPESLKTQSTSNKQCSSETEVACSEATRQAIITHCQQSYALYTSMLEQGIARETARMVLPQNLYTCWYWKIDLHNLLKFLQLRLHQHAQYEIRVYAEAILEQIVKPWVPFVYDAFCNHRLHSITLSRACQQALHDHLAGHLRAREEYGIGKGQWEELLTFLRINHR